MHPQGAKSLLVEAELDAVVDGNHDRIPRMHVSRGDLSVGDDSFGPFPRGLTDKRVLSRHDPIPERQHGPGVIEVATPGKRER